MVTGKTTLINTLTGVFPPTSGSALIGGHDIRECVGAGACTGSLSRSTTRAAARLPRLSYLMLRCLTGTWMLCIW